MCRRMPLNGVTFLTSSRRRILPFTFAVTLVTSGCAAATQSGGEAPSSSAGASADQSSGATVVVEGSVWVANEDGNSLTVLDAGTGKVVTTISGIEGPHNVQAAPDGSQVWAVSGHSNALVSLDPDRYRLSGTVPTGNGPAHVVITPDNRRAVVTNAGDGTVSSYDTAPLRLRSTVKVSAGPHGLRPAADNKTVVIANTTAGTVDVLDTASGKRVSIPVGRSPVQVAVEPGDRFAYVSLAGESAVAKVDVIARKVVGVVKVPAPPVQLYLTSRGQLLSANQGTDAAPGRTVSIIDPSTMTVSASIATGAGPHGIVADPTGTRAWVTNLYDDTVSVLDLAAGTATTVAVGDKPNGISFSPRPAAPTTATNNVTVPDYSGSHPVAPDGNTAPATPSSSTGAGHLGHH